MMIAVGLCLLPWLMTAHLGVGGYQFVASAPIQREEFGPVSPGLYFTKPAANEYVLIDAGSDLWCVRERVLSIPDFLRTEPCDAEAVPKL